MPELDPRIFEALQAGAVVVTGDRRLAGRIRQNYARHQAARGHAAWETGDVIVWRDWLARLGEQVLWSGYSSPHGRRALLQPLQERLLWQRVIGESRDPIPPLNIVDTAAVARGAWGMIQRWRLPDPGTMGFPAPEHDAFSRWMRDYHERCREAAWLDEARVVDSLVPAISSGAVAVPRDVVITGFDAFDPQARALLRALAAMGSRLRMVRPPLGNSGARRVIFESGPNELDTAMRWLRERVATDDTQRIGFVIPHLDERVAEIERILDETLIPGSAIPGSAVGEKPYTLGAGRALRKEPVVVAADHVLALCMGSISMRVLSRIVRSPFVAGGLAEAARRAGFDAWMRSCGSVDVDIHDLPAMLDAYRLHAGFAADDFVLEAHVRTLLASPDHNSPQRPSDWVRHFRDTLAAFGWPGEARPTEMQQQAIAQFNELLAEYESLDAVVGEVSAAEALRLLRQTLRQRRFEVIRPDVPVTVLQPADAEWFDFDHLWLCSTDDPEWPRPAQQPNPLVPLEWQLRHGLPDSSADRQIRARRRIADRLLCSAPEPIVSMTRAAPETRATLFVPALYQLPEVNTNTLEIAELTDYRQALVAATDIEELTDERAPPLDPIEAIDTDSRVLSLQSACPFRAFAELRLDSPKLQPLRPGLLPETRHELVRFALEHMWHRIESSEVLQAALTGEHLEVQIWEVADTVLAVMERRLPIRLSGRYRALEHARLVRLLMHWLLVEQARAPFEVTETGAERSIEIGTVNIKAKIDRIDRVGDHGSAAIAYTRSPFRTQDWLGERPERTALPLWSLSGDGEHSAYLVGCIAAGAMELAGVQRVDGAVNTVPLYEASELARISGLDWDGLHDHWRGVLTGLAESFAGGDAVVDPRDGRATCAGCHLGMLCRVSDRVFAQ